MKIDHLLNNFNKTNIIVPSTFTIKTLKNPANYKIFFIKSQNLILKVIISVTFLKIMSNI